MTAPGEHARHLHTPGPVLREEHRAGVRWVTVRCSTCGDVLPARRAS